jgi:purine-binding chemotaxis protein CheW
MPVNQLADCPIATAATGLPVAGPRDCATALVSVREFLVFKLGQVAYGIDIQRVQEIRSYEPPTRIANAPKFIKAGLDVVESIGSIERNVRMIEVCK